METALGRWPIEEIAIGYFVAARDGFTGEVGWRPVRELFRRTAPSIAHATLDGPDGRRETRHVTSEHPFFVASKGWVEVRRLERGDRIIPERESDREAVLAVADVSLEERPTLVYNFEVAQDHNYLVGDEGAEAHSATIFDRRGIKGVIYPNDHAPPHMHIYGGGYSTRVGRNGKAISNDPSPTKAQQEAIDMFKKVIRKAIHDEMKRYQQ
nr:polymorphic toxin-type HINT domain-containing protein [Methylosinus sporium]